jgi:hypothetical protein
MLYTWQAYAADPAHQATNRYGKNTGKAIMIAWQDRMLDPLIKSVQDKNEPEPADEIPQKSRELVKRLVLLNAADFASLW